MITAGTAIGAGMFSLPIVSSGMWIGLTIFMLLIFWQLNYLSSLYILEANFKFKPGASFNTIVEGIIGKRWGIVSGIAIALLMYVILYAYFSALGNVFAQYLAPLDLPIANLRGVTGVAIGGFLAFLVWLSTKWVGRISTILVIGMALAFIASMAGLAPYSTLNNILNHNSTSTSRYLPYMWSSLPYFLTSFGFATVVPSLYKYYGKDKTIIKKSLFNGSAITLVMYLVFIGVNFGTISRFEFIAINDAGGNIGTLITAMSNGINSEWITIALNFFSNLAIITSFLGIGLSLFDYLADKFNMGNSKRERVYTALMAFVAPGALSFFYPDGFIQAIGFAGLIVVLSFFVIPFFFIVKLRKQKEDTGYRVPGKNKLLVGFLSASVVVAACHVLNMMGHLPTW